MMTKNQISQLLVKHDIEGLIELGAPDDEYESETEAIFSALQNLDQSEMNLENVAAIILKTWRQNFDLDQRQSDIKSLAHNLVE